MGDEAIGALHAKGGSRISLSSRQLLLSHGDGIEYRILRIYSTIRLLD